DQVVAELVEQAYGPRPLDFELIRKLANDPGSVPFARPEQAHDAAGATTSAEEEIGRALFEPRGDVVAQKAAVPDRPRAWLVFETAEAMEAEPVARRVADLSGGGSADLVENFPWDRWNIHAPAIQALIAV